MNRDAHAHALFLDLCDRSPAAQAAALGAAEIDPELRAQVSQMLVIDRMGDDAVSLGGGRALLDAASALPDAPPEQIAGYRILRALGAGGMGVVFEAEQVHPRRRVALKLPHLHLHTPALLAQFRAEAQALADLQHPAIPAIFEAGVDDGQPFLAMARVDGQPLYSAAAALPLAGRTRLLLQLCDGVAHAHAQGVVHRDLKPSNVLVDANGAVHVVDFGLATVAGATAQPAGTPRYMAPERLHRDVRADPRADVYALGYVIWETASGTPAPDSGPLPALPSEAVELGWIVAKATAADPAARYRDATQMATELRRVLAQEPVDAGPRRAGRVLGLWARRHRRLLVGGVLCGCLSLAMLGGQRLLAHRAVADRQARAAARLDRMQRERRRLVGRGAIAESDAIFDAFVGLPEHAGTRALARAWLRRAAEARGAEDWAVELRAVARAFSAAPDPTTRRASLEALASSFAARGDWVAAEAALERLQRRSGGLSPAMTRLSRRAQLMRGDLVSARATAPRAWQPMLHHLSRATPTQHTAFGATRQGDALVLIDQAQRRLAVVEPTPDLVLRRAVTLPPDRFSGFGWPSVRFRPAPTLLGWHGGQVTVDDFDLVTGARVELARFEESRPLTMAWRRCRGRSVLHVGTGPTSRRLLTIDPMTGWRPSLAHQPSASLGSDVDAVLPMDLDGDGCEELIVARGAWRAYELSVLGEAPDGALRELDGARLGAVTALAMLPGPRPYLVAAKTDRYVNGLAWADPEQRGAADGLHILAWDAGLKPVAHLALPPGRGLARPTEIGPIVVGDLDGDARADLAIRLNETAGESLWILRQTAEAEFESLVIGGVVPVLATQLDDDAADELIVRSVSDDRTWVLGAGDASLPARERRIARPPPPAAAVTGDGPLQAAARRSETLAELGLAEEGAAQIATLSHLAEDPTLRRALLRRSAHLYAAYGAHREALRMHRTLAKDAVDRPAALIRRARSEEALHLYREARATLYEAGARHEAAALDPVVGAAKPFQLAVADPLAGWRLIAPHLIRAAPEGLTFDLFNRRGLVAERRLERLGPRLAIELDLTVNQAELGAGLEVVLADADRTLLRCAVLVNGGGDRTDHALVGTDPIGRDTWRLVASPGVAQPVRLTLRASWRIDTGEVLFETTHNGARQLVRPDGAGVEPGRPVGRALTLSIRSRDLPGWIAPAAVSGRITRLVVEGARAMPDDADASQPIAQSPIAPAHHALAQAQRGDLVGAARTAAAAPDDETLLEVLRLAPAIALTTAAPDRAQAIARLLAAWRGAWRHRGLEAVRTLLRSPALASLPGDTAAERAYLRARIALALEGGAGQRAQTIVARLLARGEDDAEVALLAARVFAETPAARVWARRFAAAVGSPRVARARLARYGLDGHLDPPAE